MRRKYSNTPCGEDTDAHSGRPNPYPGRLHGEQPDELHDVDAREQDVLHDMHPHLPTVCVPATARGRRRPAGLRA